VSVRDCAISSRYGRMLSGHIGSTVLVDRGLSGHIGSTVLVGRGISGHIGSTVLVGRGLLDLFILLPVTYGCTRCLGVIVQLCLDMREDLLDFLMIKSSFARILEL
jgi:hypothetical protein